MMTSKLNSNEEMSKYGNNDIISLLYYVFTKIKLNNLFHKIDWFFFLIIHIIVI